MTGRDLLTGDVRWRFSPPRPGADRRVFAGEVRLFAVDGLVGVTVPGWTASVLSSSGEVLRASRPGDADHLLDPVAGRLVLLSTTGSGALLSTLVERGRADVDVPGELLPLTVDDGSVPGLVLTSSGDVRGWDAATGESRWRSDVVASVNALLLDGRVYVSTRGGVAALDGRTGDLLWRASRRGAPCPGSSSRTGGSWSRPSSPSAAGTSATSQPSPWTTAAPFGGSRSPDNLWSSAAVGHLLIGWGRRPAGGPRVGAPAAPSVSGSAR